MIGWGQANRGSLVIKCHKMAGRKTNTIMREVRVAIRIRTSELEFNNHDETMASIRLSSEIS
jgi:hypothetical protein